MKSDDIGYSYIRFSDSHQSRGDSLRRQTEAATLWCQKNGVRLDTSLTLRDLGKSAYTGEHRKNPDRNALACFLRLVENGKVPAGSYLVVENLDRLSREEEVPACHLLTGILMAGVRVVQLIPSELVLTAKSNGFDIMRAVMELSRGHGESAVKSDRVGSAWREKKRRAANGEKQKETDRMGRDCRVLTRRLPSWVERRGGKLVLIPGRAAAVKRIFALSAAGYGPTLILKRLTEEKVPAFGDRERVPVREDDGTQRVDAQGKPVFRWQAREGCRLGAGRWTRTYVVSILKDRRAMGEHQPRNTRTGKPDGPPIKGYYPPVVGEEEWQAARGASAARRRRPGRVGPHVNIFAGLIKDALDGDSYFMQARAADPRQHKRATRVLFNHAAVDGRARYRSFPFDVFEWAVLSKLAEVKPHEVMGREDGPDEVQVLSGTLAGVEAKIAELEAELLNGDVAALARVLREQEARKTDLAARLAEARQKAAHPLSEAWGQARSLFHTLAAAPDPRDARLRLRSALRRVVSEIRLLVVPRGRGRLAAVQVYFTDDGHRDYLIVHRPPMAFRGGRRKPEFKGVIDLPPDLSAGLALDLLKPQHALDLVRVLELADVEKLAAAMKNGGA
jgi:DNA invertase Pin-like site-specific DNA recombinase